MGRRKDIASLLRSVERPLERNTAIGVASSIGKDGEIINGQNTADGEVRDMLVALPYGVSSSGVDGIRVQMITNDNNNNTVVGVIDKNRPPVKSGCVAFYDKSGTRIVLGGDGTVRLLGEIYVNDVPIEDVGTGDGSSSGSSSGGSSGGSSSGGSSDSIDPNNVPYIQNGYWYVNGVNTNVKAQGEDGVGISKIEKTATENNIDTYTITLTNGNTDTFTVTNGIDGEDGEDGADGKSAYEYAKDGGYTGTEAEFAEKLTTEYQAKTDETLKTTDKTVVGAINEVAEQVNKISDSNGIVGTWVFNDELTSAELHIDIKFESDGMQYDHINFDGMYLDYTRHSTGYIDLAYDDGTWMYDAYKTITILEEPTDTEFISWLKANATKQVIEYQTRTDDALETDSKEVVGAINELKGEVGASSNITNGKGEGSIQSIGDRNTEGTSADTAVYEDENGNEVFDYNSDFNTNAATEFKAATGSDLQNPVPYGSVGRYAQAIGGKASAQGKRSRAEGTTTIAYGDYSHAGGNTTIAIGGASRSEGLATTAVGEGSFATGYKTIARGDYSASFGKETQTTDKAEASFTGGYKTQACAKYATALGYYSGASGENSFAANQNTKANTKNSSAFGLSTVADGTTDDGNIIPQFVAGRYNRTNGNALFIVGDGAGSKARSNALEVLKDGKVKVYTAATEDTDVVNKQCLDDAINEVDGYTIDKITALNFYSTDVNIYESGIVVSNNGGIATEKTDEASYFSTYMEIPIVAGDNVTFTLDEENQVVKINATGGSSSGLPNIRFVGVRSVNSSMKLSEDNPFIFTVENMGGGTLQVGDKLQICVMRWYLKKEKSTGVRYKKQRLRRMCEYEITEEDIGKRLLKITVHDSDQVRSWLFRNDRQGSSFGTLSYMYFRLKRVTSYHVDGEENNAIFSNIVKVTKTYDSSTQKLIIK